jgi:uncharacterized membrane protein YeaQ/YmgE (transglycosylase-associated protein family)
MRPALHDKFFDVTADTPFERRLQAVRRLRPHTTKGEPAMIGALLTGLVAGIIGRLLVPDMWSELSGPSSWLFSLVLGLAGALLGYLIFTVGLGIGDTDVLDFGGIIGAVIGVVILLPFVGIYARLRRRSGSH